MSQIFRDGATGPVPPTVPQQFTADDSTVAVPVANNLNVLSRETTDNNLNGIQTTADPNGSDNLLVELTNRVTGAISTPDATPATIITFPLGGTAAVFVIQGLITGHNTTSPSGGAYFFTVGVRTDGAAATLLGPVDFGTEFEELAMQAADFDVTVVGNSVVITVTGIALTAIDWLAQFTYSRVI